MSFGSSQHIVSRRDLNWLERLKGVEADPTVLVLAAPLLEDFLRYCWQATLYTTQVHLPWLLELDDTKSDGIARLFVT